jgi:hypothetical protein
MGKGIFNKQSMSILRAFIPPFLPQHEQIQSFNFVSGPWGLAQELQTGTDAGVLGEASYWNPLPKFKPSEVGFKLTHNGLKGQTMQRVSRLFMDGRCIGHDGIFPQIQNCRL